jgi:hypothetical protein
VYLTLHFPTNLYESKGDRHLPVELNSQIFECFQLRTYEDVTIDIKLKWRDDLVRHGTLRGICLVSSDFHRIAWPILYRVFPFTSELLDLGNHTPNHCETRDKLYLETLRRQPPYADALRFV